MNKIEIKDLYLFFGPEKQKAFRMFHILFFSTLKVCYLAWYNLVIQSNIYQEGCCHGCKRR